MNYLKGINLYYSLVDNQNQRTLLRGSSGRVLQRSLQDLRKTLDAVKDNPEEASLEQLADLDNEMQIVKGNYDSNVNTYFNLFTDGEIAAVTEAFARAMISLRKVKALKEQITKQMGSLVLSLTDTRDQWETHLTPSVTLGDLKADLQKFLSWLKLVEGA